ncbi:MAG: 30S ribosomal protein S6 [Candidatus Hodgkinia cicadicola]
MQNKMYELVVFLKPDTTDAVVGAASKHLKDLLNAIKAENIVYTNWGRVNLAYKIRGCRVAVGLHLSFKLDKRVYLLEIEKDVRTRLKPLRFCLISSSSWSATIAPSFYKVTS